MTAPLSNSAAPHRTRKPKRTAEKVVLFDQENATAVWRLLDQFMPKAQVELAETIGISQSAISEWRTSKRLIPFARIPDLAEAYGVPPLLFLTPADEVAKAVKPHLDELDRARKEITARAQEVLRTMRTYSELAAQPPMFEVSAPNGKRVNHLQDVSLP